MKEYTYPWFNKMLYRYGNIPLTILLLLFLTQALVNLDSKLINIIPVVITSFILYYLNKQYLYLYKIIPYRIVAQEDKLVCDHFIFSTKSFDLHFKDVISISGGFIEGKRNSIIKIDSRSNFTIGFYHTINNARELETLLLSKVDQPVYEQVAKKMGWDKKEQK
jgi:hypothetical protein